MDFMIWTGTDARKHDIGAIDAMYVVYFINNIKQTHYLIGWKKAQMMLLSINYLLTYNLPSGRNFLRFSIFKSKFLKDCNLKTPYMHASIYQTNREKWNITWHDSKPMYLLCHQTLKYFFIMSIYTLDHVNFLSLRQGRDKHMHNDVHTYGIQAHKWIRWRRRRNFFEICNCSCF